MLRSKPGCAAKPAPACASRGKRPKPHLRMEGDTITSSLLKESTDTRPACGSRGALEGTGSSNEQHACAQQPPAQAGRSEVGGAGALGRCDELAGMPTAYCCFCSLGSCTAHGANVWTVLLLCPPARRPAQARHCCSAGGQRRRRRPRHWRPGRPARTWTATVRRERVASLAGAAKARVAVEAAKAIVLGCCCFHTSGAKRAGCGLGLGWRKEGAPAGRYQLADQPHLCQLRHRAVLEPRGPIP